MLKEQHSQQEDGDGLASVREDEQPRSVELQLDIPEETGEGSPAMALQDSDSEPDDADKREFITDAMGWNVSSRSKRATGRRLEPSILALDGKLVSSFQVF